MPVALALVPLLSLLAVPAEAQLCSDGGAPISRDGRAFGHLPYGDAPPASLVPVPDDLAVRGCEMRTEVIGDLTRLIQASGGRVRALSCHRSITHQQEVFCRERGTPDAERALSVAPPGHSEHATGFALDFAFRPRENECPDAEACVAASASYRWLVANAPAYGFEMSFPAGNKQNVKWEPWHWRWVGTGATEPGAALARFTFARARREFPANPGVDTAVRVSAPPPPAWLGALPAPACDKKGRCKLPKQRR